jgi:hypothetical protein
VWMPLEPLLHATRYTLTADTTLLDQRGLALDQEPDLPGRQPFSSAFTTEADTIAPRVVAITPADSSRHVQTGVTLQIDFSEPLAAATVLPGTINLSGGLQGDVPTTLELTGGDCSVRILPLEPLTEGVEYTVQVLTLIRDLSGNRLDQDPLEPGYQGFAARFTTGRSPVAVWGRGQCLLGDTARVTFDAGASFDPDPDDSLTAVVWEWGDGARDSLAIPIGLTTAHDYACQDIAGCDGIDNDLDGLTDESGPEGCDESYRVVLRLYDAHGFASADTAGVSFCAFLVRASEPADGAGEVPPEEPLRLYLTRPLAPESVTGALSLRRVGAAVTFSVQLEDDGRLLRIQPDSLLARGLYTLDLTAAATDTSGVALDQEPCQAGRQGLRVRFSVGRERARRQPQEQQPGE